MADVEVTSVDAQREAAYQEIKRRMALLDDPKQRQLRYFFSVTCIHVRQIMPVIAANDNEALWRRWVREQRESPSNSQVF